MGGKSSSSSSSSNSTTTENYDQRVAVESQGLGVGAYANLDLTVTDYGVIEGAAKVLDTGLSAAADVVDKVTKSFGQVVTENTAVLKEATQSDTKEIAVLVIKFFGAIVAGLMVLWFLVRGR